MLSRRQVLLFPLVCLAGSFAGAHAFEPDEATALIKGLADQVLSILQTRRAEFERDPEALISFVETLVLPHFDFERITQGAVGPAWRQATPAQQRRLVEGFKRLLVRTYARSLLNYSGQEIRYFPPRPGQRPGTLIVVTEVREPGAAPIPIEYRMHSATGRWQIYDVVINNVSLVGSYRSSFVEEIQRGGIDGLIQRLDALGRQGQG